MHRTHHDRSRQAGTIVNTASKQGITAPPGNTAYNGEQSRSQDLNLHGRVSRLQSALFKDSYATSFTFSARIETTRDQDERRILWAAGDLVENRPALSRWHPAFKEAFEAFMKAP